MGVSGAWNFLSFKEVEFIKSNTTQHQAGIHSQKTIHLDLVGAFYRSIREYFLHCHEHDDRMKTIAANRLLAEISTVVDKRNAILYIDGTPTFERDFAHGKRLEKLSKTQELLEQEICSYNKLHTKQRHKTIIKLAKQMFRVDADIEHTIYKVAKKSGWNVKVADGEAEVAIGKSGGIVLTQDSDMLFYPNIDTVICPFDGTYRFYNKKDILQKLNLSSEYFTALGILAKNDYDDDFYACQKDEANSSFYRDRMVDIYKELVCIKSESLNTGALSSSILIHIILKTYVSFMNAKTGQSIHVDDYQNSYNVFALQQEQKLLESYDSRTFDINRPAYYLDKIRSFPRYG